MVEFFCRALKHQAYSPCRVPGARKHLLSAQSPWAGSCVAQHRGSPVLSILSMNGCHWQESQSLGHQVETIGPRKAQHPLPAASGEQTFGGGAVFSGKKRKGSSRSGVTETPLLFKSSLGFRDAVALTCLCQDPAAGLSMGHCSPPWSRCL